MIDAKRNTFKYKGYDVTVAYCQYTPSHLEFSIPDRSLPNAFFSFAYFDEVDDFIALGLDWDKYRETYPERFH